MNTQCHYTCSVLINANIPVSETPDLRWEEPWQAQSASCSYTIIIVTIVQVVDSCCSLDKKIVDNKYARD